MQRLIRTSFKRKLLLCFLVVALLPLIICNAFMISSMKARIQNSQSREALDQLNHIEEKINTFFVQLETISEQLSVNETVMKTLYIQDAESKKNMYIELYGLTFEVREYADLGFYSLGGNCKYSTDNMVFPNKLPTYWGILRAAKESDSFIMLRTDQLKVQASTSLLQAACPIKDESGYKIGFIVSTMDADDFEKMFSNSYNSSTTIMIIDQYWHTIYSMEDAQDESIVPTLRNQLMQGKSLDEINKDKNYYVKIIGNTGLYLVLEQKEVFTSNIIKTMYGVCIIMELISLILCVVVAVLFSKSLTKPINHLSKAMHELESGNMDVQVKSERKDEIGRLSDKFNTMTNELKTYMTEQVKQQQELNNANIGRMQAQLNPHFLYNTLDTMKWVAKANHVPEIATLSTSLAKILRVSISQKQFIPLREEMTVVQSYIDIQQIRFSEKFEYSACIPEEFQDCIVPKLVIQPLVENSIIHGLADRDSGIIQIIVESMGHHLRIHVIDDGCGVEPEIMEQLNSREHEQLAGHLGFYNVDKIIQLQYGRKYGLRASQREGGGTIITVSLPILREEDNAESACS